MGLSDPIAHNNFPWPTELSNIFLYHYIHYNVSCNLIYLNIIFHVDKCVHFTFAPPIIPLIYVPGHDLNSNASLNLDAPLSLSFLYGCTWNIKIACTINKKSAKLIAIHNIPLPHTHIIIYCNKLNSVVAYQSIL